MLLRELFDLLLYDPSSGAFVTRRLPDSAQPALREHYLRRNAGDLPPEAAGAAWFPICQQLDGLCYLSRAPGGETYELHPSLANLAAAAGTLLGQPGWDSLRQLQAYWNRSHCPPRARSQLRGERVVPDQPVPVLVRVLKSMGCL